MPPKKKPARNGFSIFMSEMMPILQKRGHVFRNGLADVEPVASPLWKALSDEEKDVYRVKAKGGSGEVERYDSRGVPLSQKSQELEQRAKVKTEMNYTIDQVIAQLKSNNQLTNHSFYFACFNYMVETEEGACLPCEVAVTRYSLASGIMEIYHDFVEPGKLPLGYSFAAREHSDASHKIPVGHKMNNADYAAVVGRIKDMLLLKDGNMSALYVLEAEMSRMQTMLDWLQEMGYDDGPKFRTYSLDKLLYELRRHADLNNKRLVFPTMKLVEEKLSSEMDFDYYPGMACQWHEDQDNVKFCSLTRVRRYAYVISDLCCEHYYLRLLPGHHCPVSVADDSKYEVLPADAKPRQQSVEPPRSAAAVVIKMESDDLRKPRSLGRLAPNFSGVGNEVARTTEARPGEQQNPAPRGRGRGIHMM